MPVNIQDGLNRACLWATGSPVREPVGLTPGPAALRIRDLVWGEGEEGGKMPRSSSGGLDK